MRNRLLPLSVWPQPLILENLAAIDDQLDGLPQSLARLTKLPEALLEQTAQLIESKLTGHTHNITQTSKGGDSPYTIVSHPSGVTVNNRTIIHSGSQASMPSPYPKAITTSIPRLNSNALADIVGRDDELKFGKSAHHQ